MHEYSGSLFKGVVTTILGVFATVYGVAGQVLSADPIAAPHLIATADPVTLANLSALLGPICALLGGLWTWLLVQKNKKRAADRDDAEKDQLSRIRVDLAKGQADTRLMLEQGLAKMELKHAEMLIALKPDQPKAETTDGGS